MLSLLRTGVLLLAFASAPILLPTASAAATATLADAPPPASAFAAAWDSTPLASGWRLFRSDQEKRDLVQHWIASDDIRLAGVAFAIHAGSRSPLTDSLLSVQLGRAPAGPATGPAPLDEIVFEDRIPLPPNTSVQPYKNGRWLLLSFPPVSLAKGDRCSLRLSFAESRSSAQEVILSIAPLETNDTTRASAFSTDGTTWQWWRRESRPGALLMRLVTGSALEALSTEATSRRILRVDPRDPTAFSTLKTAAREARAGDTLWLAPDTGPYREELYITASGRADAPIIIEGNGNEVTGFDPLSFQRQPDGRHRAVVSHPYPFVLRHLGKRVREDAATGRFLDGVTYDAALRTLTLGEGVSPDHWEISARGYAVRIRDASHQHYRDLVASGSRNDGFNLHGEGEGLRFENIVGRDNLDEGFSAHGGIRCEIIGGRFFGNENGIYNIQRSETRIQNVDIHDNLGIGLCVSEARIEAENLRVWGSGMLQATRQNNGVLRGSGILVYRNAHAARPWVTHMESSRWTAPATSSRALADSAAGSGIRLLDETAPTPSP